MAIRTPLRAVRDVENEHGFPRRFAPRNDKVLIACRSTHPTSSVTVVGGAQSCSTCVYRRTAPRPSSAPAGHLPPGEGSGAVDGSGAVGVLQRAHTQVRPYTVERCTVVNRPFLIPNS